MKGIFSGKSYSEGSIDLQVKIDGKHFSSLSFELEREGKIFSPLTEFQEEFHLQIPLHILNNQEHLFEFIPSLDKKSLIRPISFPTIVPRKRVGYIEQWKNNCLSGWTVSEGRCKESDSIDIYIDETFFSTVIPSVPRTDLKKYGVDAEHTGFNFFLLKPPSKKLQYEISAFFSGSTQSLRKSPLIINFSELQQFERGKFSQICVNPPIQSLEMKVVIIIPVFNAYDPVRQCIDSVIQHTTGNAELLLINDASTDPRIKTLLAETAECYSNVRVVNNTTNLGYTKTVNLGINLSAHKDVVLLNSDTIVGPRWLQNLWTAAYHSTDVATVTAISNNAGAFSVPTMGIKNEVPIWLSHEELSRATFQHSRIIYSETPTGNGFCLFIRRAAIENIGLFDEEAFPRGYGEENDFCVRAIRAGWRHLVDDRTFVFHVRSASFLEQKQSLYDTGRAIVDKRYPEYKALVQSFTTSLDMSIVRYSSRRLFEGKLSQNIEKHLPRILFVISTRTGGTPQTNEDLMLGIKKKYHPMLLHCDSRRITLYDAYQLPHTICEEFHLSSPITLESHKSTEYDKIVGDLLIKYGIELLHIRHLAWHSLSLPRVASYLSIPVIFSLHDFYTICPTVNLLDETSTFCGGKCTSGEGDCKVVLWKSSTHLPRLKHHFIHAWKTMMLETFRFVDFFVTTSKSAKELIKETYPEIREDLFWVIPHGRDFPEFQANKYLEDETFTQPEKLRILFPGNTSPAKGSGLIATIHKLDQEKLFEFHFIGTINEELEHVGKFHGKYERQDFAKLAHQIKPHYIGIFSVWPETYCHTLTESWACGFPVIAIDKGAVGERIRQHGGGWLIESVEPTEVYTKLMEISRVGRDKYLQKLREVREWQLNYGMQNTVDTMASKYIELYFKSLNKNKTFYHNDSSSLKVGEQIKLGVFIQQDNKKSPPSAHIRVLEWLDHSSLSNRLNYRILNLGAFLNDTYSLIDVDVLLVQRNIIPLDKAHEFIKVCRSRKLPFVFELDDDLTSVPYDKAKGGEYSQAELVVKILAREAKITICSTEPLAQRMASYAQRTVVIPNAISEYTWFKPIISQQTDFKLARILQELKLRVLYMGSSTHAQDLELVRPVFERFQKESKGIQLFVIGGKPESSEDDNWYTRISIPEGCTHYPSFVQWFRNIANYFDCAISPLVDSEFNRSKSSLKYLQYSAVSLPSLCSRVTPYKEIVEHEETGLLIKNTEHDWYSAILRASEDLVFLKAISKASKAYVIEKHLMLNQIEAYYSVFASLLSHDNRPSN